MSVEPKKKFAMTGVAKTKLFLPHQQCLEGEKMASEKNDGLCPSCGGVLTFSHTDDLKQKWYKCDKCNELTTKPFFPSKKEQEKKHVEIEKPKKQCGSCAFWLTPTCPFIDDAKKGTLKRRDAACSEFYTRHLARGKRIVPKAELPISDTVSDVFAYEGDRKFDGRVQIKSLGFPEKRFLNLEFNCNHNRDECNTCSFSGYIMNLEENFDASAFATYFDTNNLQDAFKVLKQEGILEGCKYVHVRGENETAITRAIVSDRVGNEAKAWFVYSEKCDIRTGPNWIYAKGWLCGGQRGRIGLLILEFQAESEVIQPDEKTIETSKQYLRDITDEDEPTIWKVARALYKKSNLKGEEIIRGFVADLLFVAAPTWTKTPEGPKNLAMTSNEIGETTTAKSQRQREMISWLKAGKYESGRKTSAGLGAGAEKVEGIGWVLRKGLLPSADLSFLILDNMNPHALDEHIESRRNGILMLSTIKSCELWARVRLKLLSNPTIPFTQHLHKCVALKVYDSKFIARFTFVTFTYGVKPEVRYNSKIHTTTKEEENVLNAAWNTLRYNLSRETVYTIPLELWPKIMELSKQLELKFGNEEIPLFLRANPHKIGTLGYCFALFEGTEPTEKHVQQAYDWLHKCGVDMELDEFTAQWKEEHSLSDEEYKSIEDTVNKEINEEIQTLGGDYTETGLYSFLQYIARHGQGQMEEVAAALQISNATVKRRAKEMKGLGLIKSSKQGYFFTVKGVRFWKRWLKKLVNGEPIEPIEPNSRGQTTISSTLPPKKPPLAPEKGFNGVNEITINEMPSVGDKIKFVYGKARELAVDGLFSKFALANELNGQVERNEVFKLLDTLKDEGKLASKGPEWYVVYE